MNTRATALIFQVKICLSAKMCPFIGTSRNQIVVVILLNQRIHGRQEYATSDWKSVEILKTFLLNLVNELFLVHACALGTVVNVFPYKSLILTVCPSILTSLKHSRCMFTLLYLVGLTLCVLSMLFPQQEILRLNSFELSFAHLRSTDFSTSQTATEMSASFFMNSC